MTLAFRLPTHVLLKYIRVLFNGIDQDVAIEVPKDAMAQEEFPCMICS
jgi:hypothetical protein